MTRRHLGGLVAGAGFVALVLIQSSLSAQVAPNLGTAQTDAWAAYNAASRYTTAARFNWTESQRG